jgi:hypothetical protein
VAQSFLSGLPLKEYYKEKLAERERRKKDGKSILTW